MGANSSGKSSALQVLMILKQTLECSSPETDLLLSGKYASVGDFSDILNRKEKGDIVFGVGTGQSEESEDENKILWHFEENVDANSEARLSKVEITTPFGNVSMHRVGGTSPDFRFILDGANTQYFIRIENLFPKEIQLGYNEEINGLFFCFLKDLSGIVFSKQSRRIPEFEKTDFIPVFGLLKFDQAMISNRDVLSNVLQKAQLGSESNPALETMEYYCKKLSYDSFYSSIFNANIRGLLWSGVFNDKKIAFSIEKLCQDYRKKLDDYLSQVDNNPDLNARFNISSVRAFNETEETEHYNTINAAINNYVDTIKQIMNRITYLGPIREKPQGLYNVGFEAYPKYVGPSGAFFASVLYHEDKEREYLMPFETDGIKRSLSEACAEWLEYLGVANGAKAEKQGSYGIRVTIESLTNNTSDIMNVGIGTSQVLPVLISGLLSSEGEMLLFEQPELHLHPLSQSRLADFFVKLANNKRKVIVETHSEQLLLRLRYLVLDEQISRDKIAVVFFQNKEETESQVVKIDGFGGIQYPSDFRDTNEKLIEDLLRKSIAKRRSQSE